MGEGCGNADGLTQSQLEHPGRQLRFAIEFAAAERAAQELNDIRDLHVPGEGAEQLPGLTGTEEEAMGKQQGITFLPRTVDGFAGQHGRVDVGAFEPFVPIPFVVENPPVEVFLPKGRSAINTQPIETEADILESFRFAARLKLDTFGFNRLCVYRGTPLWQEYLDRGILDDERDWDKWFKCSDIDPTVLPSETVNRARQKGYALLFVHRLFFRPWQTWMLLRTLARHMKVSDILRLLSSPFRRRKLNRKPELPARMLELGLSEPVRVSAPLAQPAMPLPG